MKYIFITGGVISGVGKGTIGSSIGYLLKQSGNQVTYVKIDPYLNVDAGTMDPYEHGEVFVLADGSQVDLDLGCYERFLDIKLSGINNITTGKVYQKVISNERAYKYSGQTVQIVPHVSDCITEMIKEASIASVSEEKENDICIVELGGTIDDIENQPFIEAIRHFEDAFFVHVCYIPFINTTKEHKTRPAQESVRKLKGAGINPNVLVCRSETEINDTVLGKLSRMTRMQPGSIISLPDSPSVYHVPSLLYEKANNVIKEFYKYPFKMHSLTHYKFIKTVKVGIVGKYIDNCDSYLSIVTALKLACKSLNRECEIVFIDCENVYYSSLDNVDCVLIAPGFGERGLEGKIYAAEWCRLNNKPTLGICFGFQAMVLEYARNICHIYHATSTEVSKNGSSSKNVITKMPKTLLGDCTVRLLNDSIATTIYGTDIIIERNRHSYGVDSLLYRDILERNGMLFSGESTDSLCILELPKCRFYVGVQFHPEFSCSPFRDHPLFTNLIKAAL